MLSDIPLVRCLWKSSLHPDVDDDMPVRIVMFVGTDNVANMIIQKPDDEFWYTRVANSYAQAVRFVMEEMLTMRAVYATMVFVQQSSFDTKSLEKMLEE